MFAKIREKTLETLIISFIFLTLTAVLSIWELFDEEILEKSLATMLVLMISAMIIVATTLWQENKWELLDVLTFGKHHERKISFLIIIKILVFIWLGSLVLSISFWFFGGIF